MFQQRNAPAVQQFIRKMESPSSREYAIEWMRYRLNGHPQPIQGCFAELPVRRLNQLAQIVDRLLETGR